MDNQPYTYEEDPDFKFCQCCGDLFLKWHDNNQFCPYCVLSLRLTYELGSWRRDPAVWDD